MGQHLMVFRAYSCPFTQDVFLVDSGIIMGCWRSNPGLDQAQAICKAYLLPNNHDVLNLLDTSPCDFPL